MDEGSGTMPLSGFDYPRLNNMADIELDALYDRIQQDCLVSSDYGQMEAWLQSDANKSMPNLWDIFEGIHLKGGHLKSGRVSFPYPPCPL